MGYLQKEGLRTNPEAPKTILDRNSAYKLRTKTAELPKLRTLKVEPQHSRHDIFKIQQLEYEILEDYLERFVYTLHKSKYSDLQEHAVCTLFLKGISEDLLESLNIMVASDISDKIFAQIGQMCKNYSRIRGKVGKNF